MKLQCHQRKSRFLNNIDNLQGIWFHIIGLAYIIWFLVRVVPAPHRARYPCQQISITVALGYVAFWGALFGGLSLWLRRVKSRTMALAPAISIVFILLFSISGMVFANTNIDASEPWSPIAKDPIGTPQGLNPGRVVWIWNPDETELYPKGYWWKKENNNQAVINQMFSTGIQGLAGTDDDYTAWDMLFKHFNEIHGYDEIGYQSGEKIAIKINMNNCWNYLINPYTAMDNDRDASPYVVKSLLRQLVNTVGVSQEDITVYDASRPIANWFYNRVYYKTYPAAPLVPEFPDVNFVDNEGRGSGRTKVEASSDKIYFADESHLTRTLPACVADAKYLINMPLLKRHPIDNGVTLSGKNLFGTWIEPVVDVHDYHRAAFTMGNPAPQTDLLAHEQIGGKTLLYIGDGTYGTKEDHKTIAKFQMYPFNNDWTNSLFFSQDPVAIDSVMYDFLHAEGTNPNEGSQNYLHQSAEPPYGVYDPEDDGEFLNHSLGVHEHWNTTFDIFSPNRYSGPSENGIDFTAYGEEYARPAIIITKPKERCLYISGNEICSLPTIFIIGDISIETRINGISGNIEKVEFYIDGELRHIDYDEPYTWSWDSKAFFRHRINAIAYYNQRDFLNYDIIVWKFF